MLDERRGGEMRGQLEALGYTGEVFTAAALKTFDPRLAVMRLLAEQINGLKVPGCCAELGVYRGEFCVADQRRLPGQGTSPIRHLQRF